MEDRLTFLIRPDVLYGGFSKIDFSQFTTNFNFTDTSAYVLTHDSLGFVNDRFIASSPKNVISYMRRINYLSRYLRFPWRFFHSEIYSSWFLRNFLRLNIVDLPLVFWGDRVRSSGEIIDDSNPSNHALHKIAYKRFFLKHSYWQLKISFIHFIRSVYGFIMMR